jgi:charged multivesicular body protein 7
MFSLKFLAFAIFVGCNLFGGSDAVKWNDLKITFGVNVFSRYGFNRVERTQSEVASAQQWVPLFNESKCRNRIDNLEFYGFPMTEARDKAVVTLYDKNGIIAGIQAWMPHDEIITEKNIYRFDLSPMFQNATLGGRKFFVLTAYFVRPDTICTTGRDANSLDTEGTGNGLWFQNGARPVDLIDVPLKRSKAIENQWTKNNCFPAMGYHNFYNIPWVRENNCTVSRPAFLLFNGKDELHGFGFVVQGTATSKKFEHPPNLAIRLILGDAPQCTLEQNTSVGSTSLHVYFISRPQFIMCPIW